MKNLILLFCCFISIGFVQCRTLKPGNTKPMFEVYKIDSINSFHLIYVKNDLHRYKIVSKKSPEGTNCNKIKLNHLYAFKLQSMSMVNGKSITPSASKYEVSGMAVDDSTTIAFEMDTQWDLFYADNLKGLCFLGN